MATHFSILVWEILWTEEPYRLQSTALQRIEHDLATKQQKKITLYITHLQQNLTIRNAYLKVVLTSQSLEVNWLAKLHELNIDHPSFLLLT